MVRQSLSPNRTETEHVVTIGTNGLTDDSRREFADLSDPFPAILQPQCLLPIQYNAMVRKRAADWAKAVCCWRS
jgi:hypothetical protein